MKNILIVLLALVAIGSLIGNVFLYQRYSTQRPIMRIGSEEISIKDYRDRLDFEYGKAVLNKMAYSKLVMQEAKKAGVLPTDEDIKKRIAEIQRRNPKALEDAAKIPGKMKELEQNLTADIALENLTIKDVKISDAALKDFYSKNKAMFAVPTQAKTTIVVAQNAVDAATASTMLKDKTIEPRVIANQPRLAVVGLNGFQPNWSAIPKEMQEKLAKTIFNTPAGSVATVKAGDIFFVARVEGIANSGVESFEKIKPTVERAAKLKAAPPQLAVLARLYKNANVSFEVDKYSQFFKDIEDFAKTNQVASETQTAAVK